MIFFLRYTNWLVLPGKFILICNICSKYNVQIPPPPLPNTKHDISDNFKIFHLITFIEWWFYTHMLGTCVRVFISNDNENKSRDKEWESLVEMTFKTNEYYCYKNFKKILIVKIVYQTWINIVVHEENLAIILYMIYMRQHVVKFIRLGTKHTAVHVAHVFDQLYEYLPSNILLRNGKSQKNYFFSSQSLRGIPHI